MPWDPVHYQAYTSYRLRPALDLINRIPLESPKQIIDLGCGVGDITRQLSLRWPEATIIGVDSSGEKLERAKQADPNVSWQLADIDEWNQKEPIDLLFSNSALQWVDRHDKLFLKLVSWIAPNGVFAVQMSKNVNELILADLYEDVKVEPWSHKIENLIRHEFCKSLQFYWDLLHPSFRSLEIWETTYLQVIESEVSLANFSQFSFLNKFVDVLEPNERIVIEEAYNQRLKSSYPEREDGKILFPNRLLFILGVKAE